MSRMVRVVAPQPAFFWRDETPLTAPLKGLPAVYCRECGHSGWLGFMRQPDSTVSDNLRVIYPEYFERGRNVRYFFPAVSRGRWCSIISTRRRSPSAPTRSTPVVKPKACRCGYGITSAAAPTRRTCTDARPARPTLR